MPATLRVHCDSSFCWSESECLTEFAVFRQFQILHPEIDDDDDDGGANGGMRSGEFIEKKEE